MSKDITAEQQNRQSYERAMVMLYEMYNQSLSPNNSGARVKKVGLSVNIHGDRFGRPTKIIEME